MRRLSLVATVWLSLLLLTSVASAQQIYGEYLETRNADVYTAACFANSEVGLVGDQAIMAWRVQKGSWNGVQLDGLSVVGVAKATGTIGDPYSGPLTAKAVLILDEKATPEQRVALQAFAQAMAGELLKNITRTETVPISLEVEYHGEHPVSAKMQAGTLAGIRTRPLTDKDHICGNESLFYGPISKLEHAMAGVAVLDQFKGDGLGAWWTLRDKRSAYVGNFAR